MLKGTKAVLSSRGLQSLKSEEPELLCLPIMGRSSLGKHLWRDWGRGKWQDPVNSADSEIEDLGSDPLKHFLLPFQSCPPQPKSYSEIGQESPKGCLSKSPDVGLLALSQAHTSCSSQLQPSLPGS